MSLEIKYILDAEKKHDAHVCIFVNKYKCVSFTLAKEIEKLQKQNEKLRDALDYYTSPDLAHKLPYQAGFDYDEVIGEVARKTLKEIDNDPAS